MCVLQNEAKTYVPYRRVSGDECRVTPDSTRQFAAAVTVAECKLPSGSGGDGAASAAKKAGKGLAIILGIVGGLAVFTAFTFAVSPAARKR